MGRNMLYRGAAVVQRRRAVCQARGMRRTEDYGTTAFDVVEPTVGRRNRRATAQHKIQARGASGEVLTGRFTVAGNWQAAVRRAIS